MINKLNNSISQSSFDIFFVGVKQQIIIAYCKNASESFYDYL